ncbi:gas vesicle protein GvpO [Rugosimonospora africana]|uniref:Gas vesicle synthesis protein GvpO n=1 Tax=Rugosimonospora africana TaxID=556532 RepID=A0A8J3R2L5_9ACTN|nr:gas vesicle protein GvpO [Rugosimonospora africana]GIH20737.1 hypothetical protein Raf01_89090 [Rugosimonospora africana]
MAATRGRRGRDRSNGPPDGDAYDSERSGGEEYDADDASEAEDSYDDDSYDDDSYDDDAEYDGDDEYEGDDETEGDDPDDSDDPDDPDDGDDRDDGEPDVRQRAVVPAPAAAKAGVREVVQLTGRQALGVTALERTADGWLVEVEVVEDRRVPSSSDILGLYRVELDPDGSMTGYRRVRRYPRGRGDGREEGVR